MSKVNFDDIKKIVIVQGIDHKEGPWILTDPSRDFRPYTCQHGIEPFDHTHSAEKLKSVVAVSPGSAFL